MSSVVISIGRIVHHSPNFPPPMFSHAQYNNLTEFSYLVTFCVEYYVGERNEINRSQNCFLFAVIIYYTKTVCGRIIIELRKQSTILYLHEAMQGAMHNNYCTLQ